MLIANNQGTRLLTVTIFDGTTTVTETFPILAWALKEDADPLPVSLAGPASDLPDGPGDEYAYLELDGHVIGPQGAQYKDVDEFVKTVWKRFEWAQKRTKPGVA